MKRILSMILSLLLCVSMIPIGSLADEFLLDVAEEQLFAPSLFSETEVQAFEDDAFIFDFSDEEFESDFFADKTGDTFAASDGDETFFAFPDNFILESEETDDFINMEENEDPIFVLSDELEEEGITHHVSDEALGVYREEFPGIAEFIITEKGKTLTAEETVHFKAKFKEEWAGYYAYLYFGINPNRAQYVSLSFNDSTGYYEGNYTFSRYDAPGTYYVTYFHVNNSQGYCTNYNCGSSVMQQYFPGYVNFDANVPLIKISGIEFAQNGKTLKPGAEVAVSFQIPKNTEVSWMKVYFNNQETGSEVDLTYTYEKASGIVTAVGTLTKDMYNGEYMLMMGINNNCAMTNNMYSNYYCFTLTGAKKAPTYQYTVNSLTCSKSGKTVSDGDTVKFTCDVSSGKEISSVMLMMGIHPDEIDIPDDNYVSRNVGYDYAGRTVTMYPDQSTGLYTGTYTFTDDDVYGVYVTGWLRIDFADGYSVRHEIHQNAAERNRIEQAFLFSENRYEKLRTLSPATGLSWGADGSCCFKAPGYHLGKFLIILYKDGKKIGNRIYGNVADENNNVSVNWLGDVDFDQTAPTSGAYTFDVTVLGDECYTYNSKVASSPVFNYTAPTKKIGVATNLSWTENTTDMTLEPEFTTPATNKSFIAFYQYKVYYASTKTATQVQVDYFSSMPNSPIHLRPVCGKGYYSYKVRAISKDPVKCKDGNWSELSPAFNFTAVKSGDKGKSLMPMRAYQQPQHFYGAVGETARYEFIIIGGRPPYSYQWQYCRDYNADWTEGTWNNATGTGCRKGVFTPEITSAKYKNIYRCVVTDADGSKIVSYPRGLYPKYLQLTEAPVNCVAAMSASAKFTVSVEGGSGSYSYRWQRSTNNGSTWTNATATGYNKKTFQPKVTSESYYNYLYRCVITDSANSKITTAPVMILKPLQITAQPKKCMAAVGSKAEFTVKVAGGIAPYTYKWQYSTNGGASWGATTANGNKTATLTVPVTAAKDGYSYRCIVTSSNGTKVTSSAATLTVKPTITVEPSAQTVAKGTNAKFTVKASGVGLTYQWQYKTATGTAWSKATASGNTTATLTVPATATRNGYSYRCVVTSSNGLKATSCAAKLTVK